MNAKKYKSLNKLIDPTAYTSEDKNYTYSCISIEYLIKSILKITKYRKNIIEENIDHAGCSIALDKVYSSMAKNFYQALSGSIPHIIEIQECMNYINNKQGVKVLLMGHLGDWESIGRTIAKEAVHETYAVYHPLSNRSLNQWINNRRKAFNLQVIPSRLFLRHIISNHKENKSVNYIILADQRPYRIKKAPKINFLGRPISVNLYLDKIYHRYPLNFYYLRQHSDRIELKSLDSEETSLTKQFFQLLEEDIIQIPEKYLWSHRRWKIK